MVFRHVVNVGRFVSVCFPVGSSISCFLPDKQLSPLKHIWQLTRFLPGLKEGKFSMSSQRQHLSELGNQRRNGRGFSSTPASPKLIRTSTSEIWIMLNSIGMLIQHQFQQEEKSEFFCMWQRLENATVLCQGPLV